MSLVTGCPLVHGRTAVQPVLGVERTTLTVMEGIDDTRRWAWSGLSAPWRRWALCPPEAYAPSPGRGEHACPGGAFVTPTGHRAQPCDRTMPSAVGGSLWGPGGTKDFVSLAGMSRRANLVDGYCGSEPNRHVSRAYAATGSRGTRHCRSPVQPGRVRRWPVVETQSDGAGTAGGGSVLVRPDARVLLDRTPSAACPKTGNAAVGL